jgi:hypothetical protein
MYTVRFEVSAQLMLSFLFVLYSNYIPLAPSLETFLIFFLSVRHNKLIKSVALLLKISSYPSGPY